MIAMTIATIGRRMKKFAMSSYPSGALRLGSRGRAGRRSPAFLDRHHLGLDLHAWPDLLEALDHDALAGLQARVDHPEVPDALRRRHHAHLDGVVAAHHRDVVDPLQFPHR